MQDTLVSWRSLCLCAYIPACWFEASPDSKYRGRTNTSEMPDNATISRTYKTDPWNQMCHMESLPWPRYSSHTRNSWCIVSNSVYLGHVLFSILATIHRHQSPQILLIKTRENMAFARFASTLHKESAIARSSRCNMIHLQFHADVSLPSIQLPAS